ncbi:hypothetical protein C5B85_07885 [Pseudoclavibacter sp. AY1F1]|nr:hypothetical protein C5B85_07885 [Pseudoclavibacter sp. AY1F1]
MQAGYSGFFRPPPFCLALLRGGFRFLRAPALHEDRDDQAEAEHKHNEQRERDDGEDLVGAGHGACPISASGGS